MQHANVPQQHYFVLLGENQNTNKKKCDKSVNVKKVIK